ncbi:hypothetical protein IW261DRAFT_1568121 [Armillaria novae-zelandiae]|uniref:Uncharacterized protein n=1 Tax=Armillaria novae-zelandiae TaxID=153914 RepID=A0AA39P0C8_9AGAR|nr:hypothetical protein IW261DRAFT_1568121 [Armillaria novae-zelandiae]
MLILSTPIRSFGLNITTFVPGNVQTGDSVSVSLIYSADDPSDFFLSMYCTNNGKTDDSVSHVANFTSDTTEDISIVSLGNCIIHALLHSEPNEDLPIAESEPFDLRASIPESQSSPTGSASTDHMMVIAQMINLALGATSFLGVLGIILYLFLQRTQAKPRNRLNTKPPSPDPHSPVIIVTPDQRLTFSSPKPLASDREVRHFSLISRRTPDVPTAVRSLSLETSDPSLYSTTTNENLTILSFPLPPASTQSELQEFVARLRREASLRSPKQGTEESQGAGDVRLRRQIYGMRSEIAYLRAELDLAWALGFGSQTAPSIDDGSRRSEESGALSVHSSAPQVSSNVAS